MRDDEDALPVPRAAEVAEVLRLCAEALARGEGAVVATVIARHGSAPSTPGQKLVLLDDQRAAGTVGGGALERQVLSAMRDAKGAPRMVSLRLGAALGMCCGGSVDVMIEPLAAARHVGIVGAGHVATAVAPLLHRLGFAVTVADAREAWADASRLSDVKVVCGEYSELGASVGRSGAVIVMSHDHQVDQSAIEWALRERYAFVGGIGSRAKALRTRARLEAKGFARDDIARVRMPLGVAIGARLPEEIAVSIAGELIAWRRGCALVEGATGARGEEEPGERSEE